MHGIIAKQQTDFLQATRKMLKPGEYFVVGDSAENYSFVVQDAAQSFNWNNLQGSIYIYIYMII